MTSASAIGGAVAGAGTSQLLVHRRGVRARDRALLDTLRAELEEACEKLAAAAAQIDGVNQRVSDLYRLYRKDSP